MPTVETAARGPPCLVPAEGAPVTVRGDMGQDTDGPSRSQDPTSSPSQGHCCGLEPFGLQRLEGIYECAVFRIVNTL